jgi:hypothetical protein
MWEGLREAVAESRRLARRSWPDVASRDDREVTIDVASDSEMAEASETATVGVGVGVAGAEMAGASVIAGGTDAVAEAEAEAVATEGSVGEISRSPGAAMVNDWASSVSGLTVTMSPSDRVMSCSRDSPSRSSEAKTVDWYL